MSVVSFKGLFFSSSIMKQKRNKSTSLMNVIWGRNEGVGYTLDIVLSIQSLGLCIYEH